MTADKWLSILQACVLVLHCALRIRVLRPGLRV